MPDAGPALPAVMGSSALVAALTKEHLAKLLVDMPDPCSRKPGAVIKCCRCHRAYKTASGLVRHLHKCHGVHMDWLEGSNLLRARANEFAASKIRWKSKSRQAPVETRFQVKAERSLKLEKQECDFHGAHMDWLAGSELLRARASEFAHTKSK